MDPILHAEKDEGQGKSPGLRSTRMAVKEGGGISLGSGQQCGLLHEDKVRMMTTPEQSVVT